MLRYDVPDHRRSPEDVLLAGLRDRDALSLAEAYHRTIPAAYACACRLLRSAQDVEALLLGVYAELWADPPAPEVALEGWVRRRCFELGAAHLRANHSAPASASTAALLDDLPTPPIDPGDEVEARLAELDPADLYALVRAHDAGIRSDQQPDPHAGERLRQALVAVGSAGPRNGQPDPELGACDEPRLADWVLGLVPGGEADAIAGRVSADSGCAAWARVLRRGRHRLGRLPPAPDMGQRIVAAVLAAAAAEGPEHIPHTTATATQPAGPGEPGVRAGPDGTDPADVPPGSAELVGTQSTAASEYPPGETLRLSELLAEAEDAVFDVSLPPLPGGDSPGGDQEAPDDPDASAGDAGDSGDQGEGRVRYEDWLRENQQTTAVERPSRRDWADGGRSSQPQRPSVLSRLKRIITGALALSVGAAAGVSVVRLLS